MLLDDALLALHLLFADLTGGAALSLVFDVTIGDYAEGVLGRKRLPIRERFFDLVDAGLISSRFSRAWVTVGPPYCCLRFPYSST
jgi:hypothetical protein